jgi:uncharacterized protein YpmB
VTLRSLAVLVVAALLATACKEPGPVEEREAMTVSIQETKARHADALMANPGVISVGIGLDEKGKECIVVGVEQEDVKIRQALPEELDGYEVRVQVVGKIKAD